MAIILLPKGSKGPALHLNRGASIALCAALLVALPGVAMYLGYWMASTGEGGQGGTVDWLRDELKTQQQDITEAKRHAQENLNALTLRLSDLQSRVVRLDAVGERITELANLDKGEFDFAKAPAVGGPENPSAALEQPGVDDFLGSLDVLSKQVADREQQLGVLESMLMTRNLQSQVYPAGFPAEHGWLSSYFGIRSDPFTGRPARHEGVDIAGKIGTKILTVASGVVTWSGARHGYGTLVEINHGNGYVTRYAHNSKTLVRLGETVKKGQAVALMGSTGRSTGPHVHFEVWRNGQVVDPLKYVQAATVTAASN